MAAAGHYPANTFALEYLVEACAAHGLTRLLEIGSGHGTAVPVLAAAGLEVTGLDRDPQMVEASREAMAAAGQDAGRILLADIEDPASYRPVGDTGPYDAVLGLGILPTARDPRQTLLNIKALVRPGGHVFIEYRNVLFSLVTFNRHTRDFIVDDLLADVDPRLRDRAADFIEPRLDLTRPPHPTSPMPPRYDNPLTVPGMFEELGFIDPRPFYFHYHPAPPALEGDDADFFHAQATLMEHEQSGWRGMFLCSAFLMHARVGGAGDIGDIGHAS